MYVIKLFDDIKKNQHCCNKQKNSPTRKIKSQLFSKPLILLFFYTYKSGSFAEFL